MDFSCKSKNDAQMMLYGLNLLDFLQKIGQVEKGQKVRLCPLAVPKICFGL